MSNDRILEKAREYIALEKDGHLRAQVQELVERNDIEALSDCFYTDLEFGTGGLRERSAAGITA